MATADLTPLHEARLGEWPRGGRWSGSKAEDASQPHVLDAVTLDDGPPTVAMAAVEARFPTGTHAIYQLLLGMRPAGDGWTEDRLDDVGGLTVYDAFADPQAAQVIPRLFADTATVTGDQATVAFHWGEEFPRPRPDAVVRAMGAEQSNSSVILDDALVLKLFRRLEAGDNPELEMLGFLTDHGFPNIAELAGWV